MKVFSAVKGICSIATIVGGNVIVRNVIKTTIPKTTKPIVKGCVALTGLLLGDALTDCAYKQAKLYLDEVESIMKKSTDENFKEV